LLFTLNFLLVEVAIVEVITIHHELELVPK